MSHEKKTNNAILLNNGLKFCPFKCGKVCTTRENVVALFRLQFINYFAAPCVCGKKVKLYKGKQKPAPAPSPTPPKSEAGIAEALDKWEEAGRILRTMNKEALPIAFRITALEQLMVGKAKDYFEMLKLRLPRDTEPEMMNYSRM